MGDHDTRASERVSLDDVLITEELARRPSRPPDYEAEVEALTALARTMCDAPAMLLQRIADAALSLSRAGSAGVTTVEPGSAPAVLRWSAVAGAWAGHAGSTLRSEESPCGAVRDRGTALLFDDPGRRFPRVAALRPPAAELLAVPFHDEDEQIGTLWIVTHTREHRLDAEDERALQRLSQFAVMAYRMSVSLRASEAGRAELTRQAAGRARELEQANAALAESEHRFRLVVEGARSFAMFMCDTGGHIVSWSPAAQTMLGWSPEEAIGQHTALIFSAQGRAAGKPERELAVAAEDGQAADEEWHVKKDGSRFWARGEMTSIRAPDGRLRGFVKILRDETARKRIEDALEESEERLRVALTAAEMGTWLWRIRSDQQVIDDALRRLMGLRPEDVVKSMADFVGSVHPEDRERTQAEFDRCVRTIGDFSVEFRTIWADGSVHWLRDQGKTFAGEDGYPLFMTGACVDITERRRMEEELRENDRRKDEFLAMLGHELRNPLAPLRGVTEMLCRGDIDGTSLGQVCSMMERQVGHLTRLVDDLLDVSRITRGLIELRKETVNLADVADQAIEMATSIIEARDHELSVTLPRKPICVAGDATRLTQVVFNLLNNAAKYTGRGGRLRLVVEREQDQAVVRVADNGTGMPPDLVPRVFDLFTQGERTPDRSQGGLGLGLALVKRLVELHGGSAEARSDGLDRGSEFMVRLPVLTATTAAPPLARGPESRPAPPSTDRILVIDDNHDVAESLRWMLQGLAREIHVVHSGAEALAAAPSLRPSLILCDLGMPMMDGFETCRLLRRLEGLERTLIVAVSGYDGRRAQRRAEEAGFDRQLVKPIGRSDLEEVVRTVAVARSE